MIKMKVEIILLSLLILIISLVGMSCYTIYRIKLKEAEEINIFRKEQIHNVKKELKNYVDIVYEAVKFSYYNATDKEHLIKYYGPRLSNIIDISESILKYKEKLVTEGKINKADAQNEAKKEIGQIRYDNGVGYIWINDMEKPFPKMIMHPTVPSLNGEYLNSQKFFCAMGKGTNLFVEAVNICKKKGSGFIDYLWPKPTADGIIHEVPKLSYVRLYKKWGWIIGTGIYVDDATKYAITLAKDLVETMRYNNGTGYFWINDTSEPIPKMIMHPTKPSFNGKLLDTPEFYHSIKDGGGNFVSEGVKACKKNGDGFINYSFQKPSDPKKIIPKISYVKLFKPLGWVIGSGVYLDQLNNTIDKKKKSINNSIYSVIYQVIVMVVIISIFSCFIMGWTINKHLKRMKTLSVNINNRTNS